MVLKLGHRKADQKYFESSEMWCWRWMKIIWTYRVKSEAVLFRVNREHPTCNKERKVMWICHFLRKNCLLKRDMQATIDGRMRKKT
jgi:hypothetical protein